jgi:iron complex transport system ATP-binding protein
MKWRRPRCVEPEMSAPLSGALLAASHVTVQLGGRVILDDVSLEVGAGEVLALLGPNGAGKSTFLAVLSGERAPDAGEVSLCGRRLQDWSLLEQSRRRALLPQSSSMAFPFTVEEVVRMGRAPWTGTTHADGDDEVIADCCRATDVTAMLARRVPSLSGGERARVAMARVLAQRTPVLLLDEPTAALDLHHQETLLQVARGRAADGCAVIAVLHSLDLAAAYADRIALLGAGRICAAGPTQHVLNPALLSQVFSHEVDVFHHPRTGQLVVLPVR